MAHKTKVARGWSAVFPPKPLLPFFDRCPMCDQRYPPLGFLSHHIHCHGVEFLQPHPEGFSSIFVQLNDWRPRETRCIGAFAYVGSAESGALENQQLDEKYMHLKNCVPVIFFARLDEPPGAVNLDSSLKIDGLKAEYSLTVGFKAAPVADTLVVDICIIEIDEETYYVEEVDLFTKDRGKPKKSLHMKIKTKNFLVINQAEFWTRAVDPDKLKEIRIAIHGRKSTHRPSYSEEPEDRETLKIVKMGIHGSKSKPLKNNTNQARLSTGTVNPEKPSIEDDFEGSRSKSASDTKNQAQLSTEPVIREKPKITVLNCPSLVGHPNGIVNPAQFWLEPELPENPRHTEVDLYDLRSKIQSTTKNQVWKEPMEPESPRATGVDLYDLRYKLQSKTKNQVWEEPVEPENPRSTGVDLYDLRSKIQCTTKNQVSKEPMQPESPRATGVDLYDLRYKLQSKTKNQVWKEPVKPENPRPTEADLYDLRSKIQSTTTNQAKPWKEPVEPQKPKLTEKDVHCLRYKGPSKKKNQAQFWTGPVVPEEPTATEVDSHCLICKGPGNTKSQVYLWKEVEKEKPKLTEGDFHGLTENQAQISKEPVEKKKPKRSEIVIPDLDLSHLSDSVSQEQFRMGPADTEKPKIIEIYFHGQPGHRSKPKNVEQVWTGPVDPEKPGFTDVEFCWSKPPDKTKHISEIWRRPVVPKKSKNNEQPSEESVKKEPVHSEKPNLTEGDFHGLTKNQAQISKELVEEENLKRTENVTSGLDLSRLSDIEIEECWRRPFKTRKNIEAANKETQTNDESYIKKSM